MQKLKLDCKCHSSWIMRGRHQNNNTLIKWTGDRESPKVHSQSPILISPNAQLIVLNSWRSKWSLSLTRRGHLKSFRSSSVSVCLMIQHHSCCDKEWFILESTVNGSDLLQQTPTQPHSRIWIWLHLTQGYCPDKKGYLLCCVCFTWPVWDAS